MQDGSGSCAPIDADLLAEHFAMLFNGQKFVMLFNGLQFAMLFNVEFHIPTCFPCFEENFSETF